MKEKILIGLVGGTGSGKSTTANVLRSYFSRYSFNDFKKLKEHQKIKESNIEIKMFAYPVKKIVSLMTGCSMLDLEDRNFKNSYCEELGMTYRELLDYIGTGIGRKLNGKIWINRTIQQVKISTKSVIIPDVRFINEAKAIKEMGGILIRCTRQNGEDANLASEQEHMKIVTDYTVDNNSHIVYLEDQCIGILEILRV